MSADTLPYASLLGLARVLDGWLGGRDDCSECVESHDARTPTVADADDLIRRLAADGFDVRERPTRMKQAAIAGSSERTGDAVTLDEAWAEAEAALPEGWRFGSLRAAVAFDGYVTSVVGWTATAHEASGIGHSDPFEGYAATPAAALQALAARLRESRAAAKARTA